jgi:hypothetical protein
MLMGGFMKNKKKVREDLRNLERGFTKEKELEESLKYEIAKEQQDVYKQSGNKNK